jgi:hypothetical protein
MNNRGRAMRKFIAEKDFDPVEELMGRPEPVLPKGRARVEFPLFLVIGMISR